MRRFTYFAVAAFLLVTTEVRAQGLSQVAAPPPAEPASRTGTDCKDCRFPYAKPNRAPAVSNLDKLFPGVVQLKAEHLLELHDGNKGRMAQIEYQKSFRGFFQTPDEARAGRPAPIPDPKFLADVRERLATGRYREKVYRGLNCRIENSQLVGECNMELDWPLSYQDSQSRYPPTNVGFDMHTLILEDMEITTGPFRGRWVRPVITTYFVLEAPRKNTETGRLFQVEQPCVNTTGEDGNPPAPPAPAPPPPPPQPPPSTAAPPPPPTKTDVEFFKIAVNKDGEPRDEVPESFSSIRFVGTAGGATYPVEFAGISKFTWTDADGDRHEAERARFLVRGVTFGPADLTLAIREDAVPRGFEDQTKLLNIAIPPDGKWLVHQPSSEPPLYKNLRKGSFCGRYAWKCWAPIAIAGGVTYVVTRGDNPREPQPVKRGGPGGSP